MASVAPSIQMTEVTRAIRRTVLFSIVAALLSLVLFALLKLPIVGWGIVLGFAVAVFNLRLMDSKIAGANVGEAKTVRKGLILHSLGRLLIVTAVVIGSFFISKFLAVGALIGLVLFQIFLLLNMAKAALVQSAPTATNDLGGQL